MTTQLPTAPFQGSVDHRRFEDLDRLRRTSPMYDAVIEEIDGRRIRIGDHWLTDWAWYVACRPPLRGPRSR